MDGSSGVCATGGLTGVEREVLQALSVGPRAPAAFEVAGGVPAVIGAFARLEQAGATRMAGSSDAGPWMLTPHGLGMLWAAGEPSPARPG